MFYRALLDFSSAAAAIGLGCVQRGATGACELNVVSASAPRDTPGERGSERLWGELVRRRPVEECRPPWQPEGDGKSRRFGAALVEAPLTPSRAGLIHIKSP
jgi:hypothetical protein